GIADEGSAIFTDCAQMKARVDSLLKRAQEAGLIRSDVDITELLSLVAALPDRFRDADGSSRLLEIVLRGIAIDPAN
ncbi:MAG: hypothetical protein QOH84_5381, partial [Kribbellaceae bacterium]|nr:hypothetical protein [Kribbellaceae bacterium]